MNALSGQQRLACAVAALAGLWILVYWIWTPTWSPRPTVVAGRVDDDSATDWRHVPRLDGHDSNGPTVAGEGDAGSEARGPASDLAHASPGIDAGRPAFVTHIVARGETWSSIARKHFGDSGHAEAVLRANPLKDPRSLRAGDAILVPVDPMNVQGARAQALDGSAARGEANQRSDGARTYRVRERDTLSQISTRMYGSPRHASLIFEANRDRLGLGSMTSIRPGQELVIPRLPSGGGSSSAAEAGPT